MFCGRTFFTDCRNELWILCAECGLWAHEECIGNDGRSMFETSVVKSQVTRFMTARLLPPDLPILKFKVLFWV